MRAAGIVAEYNPMHMGHIRQIAATREAFAGCAIVVCMSGDFVQRGSPAIFSKTARAEAAVSAEGGADLVLELQTPFAMSRAQRFASESVRILAATGVVDILSFGSECGDIAALNELAELLRSETVRELTAEELRGGAGYASARASAVRRTAGEDAAKLLDEPNNILALEYLAALDRLETVERPETIGHSGTIDRPRGRIIPFTVKRTGARHDGGISGEDASASALRDMLFGGREIPEAAKYIPSGAWEVYSREMARGAGPVSVSSLEQGIMSQLRRMSPEDFAKLQDVSEGIEYRLYSAVRSAVGFEDACAAAKTRRYSMARIRRLLLSAYLGLDEATAAAGAQYIRVLAMNGTGRELLREMRERAALPVVIRPASAAEYGESAERLMRAESLACDLYALGYQNAEFRAAGGDLRASPYIRE